MTRRPAGGLVVLLVDDRVASQAIEKACEIAYDDWTQVVGQHQTGLGFPEALLDDLGLI